MPHTHSIRAIVFLSLMAHGAFATNGAAFISQNIPYAIGIGERIPVKIVIQNTGTTTWFDAYQKGYRLGSQNPPENDMWGVNRARLAKGTQVAPGETAEFDFTITGPQSLGAKPFQWQMVQEFVARFGDLTPDVRIQVTGRRWVHRLYEELLNREPKDEEIEIFRNTFADGSSAADIAWRFLNSPQYDLALVRTTYRSLFSREPKQEEIDKWIPVARVGGWKDLIIGVASSEDYFVQHGSSNRAMLMALYRDLIKDQPISAIAESMGKLENGQTTADCVAEILSSEAFLTKLALGWASTHFKKPNATDAEIAPWMERLRAGDRWEKLLADILGTPEYRLLRPHERTLASDDGGA